MELDATAMVRLLLIGLLLSNVVDIIRQLILSIGTMYVSYLKYLTLGLHSTFLHA